MIIDGTSWFLQFKPRSSSEFDKDNRSVITINAIPNIAEQANGDGGGAGGMRRRIFYECSTAKIDGSFISQKQFKGFANFTEEFSSYSQNYLIIKADPHVQKYKIDKMCCIGINFTPEVYFDENEAYLSQMT